MKNIINIVIKSVITLIIITLISTITVLIISTVTPIDFCIAWVALGTLANTLAWYMYTAFTTINR